MELLHQLPVKPENLVFFYDHLKKRWPQINCKTRIHITQDYQISIVNYEKKAGAVLMFSGLTNDIIRSVKESIKENTGCVINDNNYLVKLVKKCYDSKVNTYSTETYYFEEIMYKHFSGESECLNYYYHPRLDTLFIKE